MYYNHWVRTEILPQKEHRFFHLNGILSLKIANQFKRLVKNESVCSFWVNARVFFPPRA